MILKGESIHLRDWQESDLEGYRHWMQSEHKWQQFDGPYFSRPSEVEIDQKVEQIRSKILAKNFEQPRTRMVIALSDNDTLIGTVNAYWESRETNWLSCGISIYDEREWGRGLGFEALSLWIEYLFRTYRDIVRVDMRTWSGNRGMMRLAEKLGFQQEACFRRARIVKGEYYDGLAYGILREEWELLKRKKAR